MSKSNLFVGIRYVGPVMSDTSRKMHIRNGSITSAKKSTSLLRYGFRRVPVLNRQYVRPRCLDFVPLVLTWHRKNVPAFDSTTRSYGEGKPGNAIPLKWGCSTAAAKYSPA